MIRSFVTAFCLVFLACSCGTKNAPAEDKQTKKENTMEEKLVLMQEWDKVFPQSDKAYGLV